MRWRLFLVVMLFSGVLLLTEELARSGSDTDLAWHIVGVDGVEGGGDRSTFDMLLVTVI